MMRNPHSSFRRTLLALAAACLPATSVLAHTGSGIAVDKQGQVYFLDTGSGPWRIDARGELTKLPGPRYHWLTIDANSAFAGATLPRIPNGDIAKSGTHPTLLLSSDCPITTGQDGNLYYPMRAPRGGLQIVRMLPSGATSVLAILPPRADGLLQYLNGIAAGPDGAIYYTEDSAIRRITAQGQVSTVATIPAVAGSPSIPGIPAEAGAFLRGLAIDAGGVMYVAANGRGSVLRITPDGKPTTLLQLESPWSPTAVALSGSDVVVLEYLHTARDERLDWLPRVRKIAADGTASIIATVDQMPGARAAVAAGK